jgi:two-component system chemotaxis response regulator CheB
MEPARVLIVDDSRVFRSALEAALAGSADLTVAGSVYSGQKALDFLAQAAVDLVTLDVEMPGLSGLETLAAIGQLNATLPPERQMGVVMVSSFTQRGADVTVQALETGAFDFVAKPSAATPEEAIAQLRLDLVPKLRAYLTRHRSTGGLPPSGGATAVPPAAKPAGAAIRPRKLRGIVVAASTGGPPALAQLLPGLATVPAPVFIVQHMPPTFTRSLAESLARRAGRDVVEASDGDLVRADRVYIAPGGKHLALRRDSAGRLLTVCTEQPPEAGCRPAANVLFRTAAAALGADLAAIVLTGMGNDGTTGLASVRRAGGVVIAQDEHSSVVWGMPRSAIEAGLTDLVLPLSEISAAVRAVSLP